VLRSHTYANNLFFIEQDSPLGFTGMERLKDKLLMVLEKLHKEKEEEKVIVDIWCHLGHAYITNVDEGEMYNTFFSHIIVLMERRLSLFRLMYNLLFVSWCCGRASCVFI